MFIAVMVGLALSAQFASFPRNLEMTPAREIALSCDRVWHGIVPEERPWERTKLIPEPKITNLYDLYDHVTKVGGGSAHSVYKATLREDRATARAGDVIALVVGSVSKDFKYKSYPLEFKAYNHLSKLRAEKISHFIPQLHGFYQADKFFPDDFYTSAYEKMKFKDRVVRVMEVDYLPQNYEQEYIGPGKKPMSPRVVFEEIIGRWAISEVLQCSITDDDGDVIRHYMLVDDPNFLAYHIRDKVYFFQPGLSPRQVDYDTFTLYTKKEPRQLYKWTGRVERFVEDPVMLAFLEGVKEVGLFQSIEENLRSFEVDEDDPRLKADNVTHLRIPVEYISYSVSCT